MRTGSAPYTVAPSGYRLPASLTLGRVVLQVASLDRSVSYYERVTGLQLQDRSGQIAMLGAGRGEVIVELRERPGATAVPRRGRLGLFHFAILVPDRPTLGAFVRHLETLAVPFASADHLVSEALYLTDPDGLGIEVYADRPRTSWRSDSGSLSIGTLPLDLGALRAVADTAWTAMPLGTRIGHVHLQIDDLETASRFYHDALGFERIGMDIPGALFMSAGGYHHHLGTNTWSATAPLATETDARLLEWTLQLPRESDVLEATQSLQTRGFEALPDESGAVAVDPWGIRVRLTGEA